MADDRANKAGNDAKHFESLLREEQAKIVNLVNAKKSLENEVLLGYIWVFLGYFWVFFGTFGYFVFWVL